MHPFILCTLHLRTTIVLLLRCGNVVLIPTVLPPRRLTSLPRSHQNVLLSGFHSVSSSRGWSLELQFQEWLSNSLIHSPLQCSRCTGRIFWESLIHVAKNAFRRSDKMLVLANEIPTHLPSAVLLNVFISLEHHSCILCLINLLWYLPYEWQCTQTIAIGVLHQHDCMEDATCPTSVVSCAIRRSNVVQTHREVLLFTAQNFIEFLVFIDTPTRDWQRVHTDIAFKASLGFSLAVNCLYGNSLLLQILLVLVNYLHQCFYVTSNGTEKFPG